MSAILKSLTIAGGLVVTGVATYHTFSSSADFSPAALKATEADAESRGSFTKPKLPSNFFSFTYKGYEIKNSA